MAERPRTSPPRARSVRGQRATAEGLSPLEAATPAGDYFAQFPWEEPEEDTDALPAEEFMARLF